MNQYNYYFPILLQKIGYVVMSGIFGFFTRLEVRGRENLSLLLNDTVTDTAAPLIIATNHTSELDPMIVPLIFPFVPREFSQFLPLYFVSNPKEKYNTFGWRKYVYGGAFFNMLGAYSVHSGQKDYAYALSDHEELLKQKKTVFIFPEGKRTRDGLLSPGRGGIGYLVHATGARVLPVSINTFFGMTWKDFVLRQRKVVLTIGKPVAAKEIISVENPMVEDFKQAGEVVMQKIAQLL